MLIVDTKRTKQCLNSLWYPFVDSTGKSFKINFSCINTIDNRLVIFAGKANFIPVNIATSMVGAIQV